ncbi:hypothetical protein GEMRC1_007873 [Eukaryota sp. GEM-RC1]
MINQGRFEFRQPFILPATEVLFVNDPQGVVTLTNTLSFLDTVFVNLTNTWINYGDVQSNINLVTMRFKLLNNGSISFNTGKFFAEGGAISYGQTFFTPGTKLEVKEHPVIFEHYPSSSINGQSFTFNIIDDLGLISVRNYFTSNHFTIRSRGNLVFEDGAVVNETSVFEVHSTDVTFKASSNFTAKGEIQVNGGSTTIIGGIHNGYYHGIIHNSHLIYDNDTVLTGLLDFTIHTGDVEFQAVSKMLELDDVTCINGDLTLNTLFTVNLAKLTLIAGMVHGHDEVHLLIDLFWYGGGFGLSTHYIVLDLAILEDDFDAKRVMMPGSLLVNRGRVIFRGPVSVYADQGTILNDPGSHMEFSNLVFLYDTSAIGHSFFQNNGTMLAFVIELYNEFYFVNYDFAHVISGEFFLGGGGYSLGVVRCNPATTIGVTSQLFVFRSGPDSRIEGNRFMFGIRNDTGVIEVQTSFSLNHVRIQDHGRFYVTSGAYVTEAVTLTVRGTHVIFLGFENPEVSYEHLRIGNQWYSFILYWS